MVTEHGALHVLIVDDEPAIQQLVDYNFQRSGFSTVVVGDGQVAYERIRSSAEAIDLVVMDIMLPGMDGLDVCKRLRQESIQVPIILLTARDEEVDRVVGLEVGADDYVTKPFSPRELVARAKAVLRRVQLQPPSVNVANPVSEATVLRAGDVVMDVDRHEVTVRGQTVDLTVTEFQLLRLLVSSPGRVLSREHILNHIWEYSSSTDTRIVDVHVAHLREKIELDSRTPLYIRTVRGIGYKFSAGSSV